MDPGNNHPPENSVELDTFVPEVGNTGSKTVDLEIICLILN